MWNWVSYLEEEQMPAAPFKLFKEVGTSLNAFDMIVLRQYHWLI